MKKNLIIIAGAAALAASIATAHARQTAAALPPSTTAVGSVIEAVPASSQPFAEPAYAQNENTVVTWNPGFSARDTAGAASVISFKQTDQRALDETAEDLRIMSLLFSQNLDRAFAAETPEYRLGIAMVLKTQGHSVQASYIEGFGATFELRVRFPLMPPPAQATNAEPAPKDSPWERARRTLNGVPDVPNTRSWSAGSQDRQPYQSSLVETLKKQILATLANASNFRHVDPNEWVAVTVIGAPNVAASPAGAGVGAGTAGFGTASIGTLTGNAGVGGMAPERSTIMTIRVKQSDAVALAANKISQDDFIKSVEVTEYLGPASAGGENGENGMNYFRTK